MVNLSELLNLGVEGRGRRRLGGRRAVGGDSDGLKLLLELVNLVLDRTDPPPLPPEISSVQSVHKQAAHHDRMNQRKRSAFQNPKLPSNRKCILHSFINHIKYKSSVVEA